MSKLTLGSLFDGSGGFPLSGLLCGIEPLWASEVEPFPIRVTTKRIPKMTHYGDINKLNGAKVEPVDIITGGFCCQDLSVAGRRLGLHGERSGLFFQIIRIIKEMRSNTNNEYPKFAVLENVPGIYSSNNGLDFLEVLNELIKISDETLSVPMPRSGKWTTAGEIVGDNFSIAWRCIDAQFFGVPQRRRRCYIVIDFTGGRAGKILFDESRLRGNFTAGEVKGQGTPRNTEDCIGNTVAFEPGACSRLGGHWWLNEPVGALRAWMGDNQTAVAIPINTQVGLRSHKDGDVTGLGIAKNGDPAYTLQTAHSHAVAIENRPQDSRIKLSENGIVQTLDARMGMGGGNCPLVMNERQYALTVGEDIANTLTGTDYKGTQCLFEPKTLKIRSGCEGGGKGALIQNNKSATLSTSNDQTVFVPKAYGICSHTSNSMLSSNPNSGIYEAETSRTLDCNAVNPSANQGGIAVVFDGKQVTSKTNRSNPQYGNPCHTLASGNADSAVCVQGSMIGRKPENGPQGSGIGENVSFTLTEADRHAVCYRNQVGALCASDYKFPQQQQVEEGKAVVERVTFGNNGFGRWNGEPATLKANGGDFPGGENMVVETVASFYPQMKAESICYRENAEANTLVNGTNPGFQNGVVTGNDSKYIVRRLTPTECALLQGFPSDWCSGLEIPEPTEEDIAFWSEVWETHRKITGKSNKPKSRNQLVKWLKNPHSDSAEYKMWGNGVALPCVVFVLSGIAEVSY